MRARRIAAPSARIVGVAAILLSFSLPVAANAAAPRAATAFTQCGRLNARSATLWTLHGIDSVAKDGRGGAIVTIGPGNISGEVVWSRLATSPNCVSLNPLTGQITALPRVLVPWFPAQPRGWTTPNSLLP
jgi:hypothetical protein